MRIAPTLAALGSLVVITALSAAASAAPSTSAPSALPKDASTMATDDCARARAAGKTCVLSIEGEDLIGDHVGPGGVPISARGFSTMKSLIRLRYDFIPEIIKTAEDL